MIPDGAEFRVDDSDAPLVNTTGGAIPDGALVSVVSGAGVRSYRVVDGGGVAVGRDGCCCNQGVGCCDCCDCEGCKE